MRALLSFLFLTIGISTSAQFPHSARSNRVLQKMEHTLKLRIGAATFHKHFAIDRDEACYRVFVDEAYSFLGNTSGNQESASIDRLNTLNVVPSCRRVVVNPGGLPPHY